MRRTWWVQYHNMWAQLLKWQMHVCTTVTSNVQSKQNIVVNAIQQDSSNWQWATLNNNTQIKHKLKSSVTSWNTRRAAKKNHINKVTNWEVWPAPLRSYSRWQWVSRATISSIVFTLKVTLIEKCKLSQHQACKIDWFVLNITFSTMRLYGALKKTTVWLKPSIKDTW